MPTYTCNLCDFKTTNKMNYSKHNDTTKHKEKVISSKQLSNSCPSVVHHSSKNYKCKYCENVYTSQSSRSKHMKNCINSIIKDKDKDYELKDKKIEYLEKQIETYECLLRSAFAPQTINNFTYINNTFPNAPALESRDSYVNLLESKKKTLMEVLSMYYEDKRLIGFIGDYIVKYYKKKEPKEQSLWSSDIARLTYIISQACNKKGTVWNYDKKGNQMKKIIIEPALDYIREYCLTFCQKNGTNTEGHILKHMINANEIMQKIDSGELADDIVRYIAPEFTVKINENKAIKN